MTANKNNTPIWQVNEETLFCCEPKMLLHVCPFEIVVHFKDSLLDVLSN